MAAPVYSVGQVLANTDCNLWFVPIAAYKTTGTTRTSTTLSLDPDLQITLAPNSIYEVRASIVYQTTSGTSAFQWTFTVPSGATGGYSAGYTLPGPTPGNWGSIWTANPSAAGSDGLVHGITLLGMISTAGSGGTLGLQWACLSASSSITAGVGGILVARRVG